MKDNFLKRGKGKIVGCVGSANIYTLYKKRKREKGQRYVSAIDFRTILETFNRELVKQCVENSEIVRLPNRLGYIQICKFKKSFKRNRLIVNYKRSYENKFPVFYEDKFRYKWCWLTKTSLVKNKYKYKLEMCRWAKREVPRCLAELKTDYFGRPHMY